MYILALDRVWGRPRAVDIYANRYMQSHRAAYHTTSTQTTWTETTSTQTTWTEVKEVVIEACESF